MKHSYVLGLNKQKFKGYTNGVHPNCKQVINIETGEIYKDILSASKKLGISYTHMASMLNGQRKNKTKLKYL